MKFTIVHPLARAEDFAAFGAMLTYDPRSVISRDEDGDVVIDHEAIVSVRDQLGDRWQPVEGDFHRTDEGLRPWGEEALPLLATARLWDEKIFCYEGGLVAIVQGDGTYEVGRV